MNARRRRRRRSKGSGSSETKRSGPQQSSKAKKKQGQDPLDLVAFWGVKTDLPEPSQNIRITSDPTGMLRSLGPLPLGNHQTAAGHTISPIYERAVMLATALAAAGDLIEPESF